MNSRMKVVRIIKPIIVYGEHAAVDELHELPTGLANELIGSGCAEAEYPEDAPTTVRTDEPGHRDPVAGSRDPLPLRREPNDDAGRRDPSDDVGRRDTDDRTPPQQLTPKSERPGVQRRPQSGSGRPSQAPAGPTARK